MKLTHIGTLNLHIENSPKPACGSREYAYICADIERVEEKRKGWNYEPRDHYCQDCYGIYFN